MFYQNKMPKRIPCQEHWHKVGRLNFDFWFYNLLRFDIEVKEIFKFFNVNYMEMSNRYLAK